MAQFDDWCISVDVPMGNHHRRVMTGQVANLGVGIQATAAIVPSHYASEEHMARAFARLGKPAAAALIESKLPTVRTGSGSLSQRLLRVEPCPLLRPASAAFRLGLARHNNDRSLWRAASAQANPSARGRRISAASGR